MGQGCIFSGMVEVEGAYSLDVPVRNVHLGESAKLGWRGGAWLEERPVSIMWVRVGSNGVIRIPECYVSKIYRKGNKEFYV